MLDGAPGTGWSNAFYKSPTALLPAFSGARAEDWVSVDWGRARDLTRIEVAFTVDATHSLPASVAVSVRDGDRYVRVPDVTVEWADGSDALTVISFAAVRGTGLRLDLTSRYPGEARGAVRITRLESPAG